MRLPPGLYPFRSRFADVGGLQYHYVDEGSGPPVVAVHGNPTWSLYYRDLVADLRRDHRVIAVDHIGCGPSDKPPKKRYPYTLARRVADLSAVVDGLDLDDPVTLVVHDWGGAIGMGWAVAHPERVAALVVLNTAAFHLPPGKRLPAALRLARSWPLGELAVRGGNAFARGAARAAVTRGPLPPAVRRAYLAPYDSWAHRVAVAEFVKDIPLRPSDRSYGTVSRIATGLPRLRDVPMLLCWARRDPCSTPTFSSSGSAASRTPRCAPSTPATTCSKTPARRSCR